MEDLATFWKTIDVGKKKETLLEFYIKHKAKEEILRFIKLGGGPSLGSVAERFARFKFPNLVKQSSDKSYDHLLISGDKTIKVEQKTSTLNRTGDYLWQHVAEKHPWDILLLMGIHYNDIRFYGLNRKKFNNLVKEGKITNQGSKNKDSEQGLWFKYSNVKDVLVEIKTENDIIIAKFGNELK